MIDNDEFKILGEYYAKPNNVDLDWMINKSEYEQIAEEVGADYMKGNNDNELKLIKDFITKINNGSINENNAGNKFRKLKQKVSSDILRQYLIKNLERDLFGEDIEPEEKYDSRNGKNKKTKFTENFCSVKPT